MTGERGIAKRIGRRKVPAGINCNRFPHARQHLEVNDINTILVEFEGDLAALEAQSRFTEYFHSPAGKGRNVSLVVKRNGFNIGA